jgi:hypothetical protein
MFGVTLSPSMLTGAATIRSLPKDRTYICFDSFGYLRKNWIEVVEFRGWFGYNPRGAASTGPSTGQGFDPRVNLFIDDLVAALGRKPGMFDEKFGTAMLLDNDSLMIMSDVLLGNGRLVDQKSSRYLVNYRVEWENATISGYAR